MNKLSSFLVVLAGILSFVNAHSYMTNPRGRDSWKWNDCRLGGPDFSLKECHSITPYTEAGPCELPYKASQTHHSAGRGDALRVEWPRNNHPGGFVRLAWLPTTQTELQNAHDLFDGNVQLYTCFERVCHEDIGGNGGDSLGTDGGCWIDINIPTHLTNGGWTLQWTWYGGMYGEASDYYTCANFNIQGGAAVTAKADPVFVGGDFTNPNSNKCRYFTTNKLHYCTREPCSNMCNDNTAPAGHCGWPSLNGAPYVDASIQPSVPITSAAKPPPVATSAPDTPTYKIIVQVTVRVNSPPKIFDITTFVYSISGLLDIPSSAIDEVLVNLDNSDATTTSISFKISNAIGKDGNPINPIAAAEKLKELVASNDASLSTYAILGGLQVEGTTVTEDGSAKSSDDSFVHTTGFIIMIVVIVGVVVIGAAAGVIGFIVYRKKNYPYKSWF